MLCQKCGKEIPDGSTSCSYCGTPTSGIVSAPTVVVQPQRSQIEAGAKYAKYGLICGIVGLIIFGFILGVLAIVFGIMAQNRGSSKGVRGIVLGIIDIIAAIFVMALFGIVQGMVLGIIDIIGQIFVMAFFGII
jgi:RNA polymerase subunit RPABC4/transcription elongation factor Spt4